MPSGEVAAAVRGIEEKIRQRYPVIKRIYIESAGTADAMKAPPGAEPEHTVDDRSGAKADRD
jgi:hypothetical protein